MSFEVYPQPQDAPLSLDASGGPDDESLLTEIPELTGADPDYYDLSTMFIRIAMSGTAPMSGDEPTVRLQATDPVGMTPGTPVPITAISPPGDPIYDGDNPTEVAYAHIADPDANNVYLVKVIVVTPGRIWHIQIKNEDSSPREFTWVVADSDAESQQPWLYVQGGLVYEALTDQSIPLDLQVENKGTGALEITPPVPGLDFSVSPTPVSIDPNHGADLEITFNAPSIPGQTPAATYTLAHDDPTVDGVSPAPGHSKHFTLEATTRKLEVMLLIDASGSMAYKPDGTSVGLGEKARWDHLKDAVNDLFTLLDFFGGGLGRFGVAMFPDITTGVIPAPVPSSADIQTADDITTAALSSATTALSAHTPVEHGGATSMGHGIQLVMGSDYFDPDPQAVALNRRWLLLMSDGASNSVPPDPVDFHTGSPTPLDAQNVSVFAVGYGDPAFTTFHVNHTLLNNLAIGSAPGGQFRDAGANDDDSTGLRNAFQKVLIDGLTLQPVSDPTGVLTSDAPEARQEIIITPYDTKVAFIVDWGTDDKERVSVQLLTPTCELITSETAQIDPDIGYHSHSRSKIYTVNHDYLCNAGDPAHPRYGTWTLILSGRGLDGKESEPYEYGVITESRLKLELASDQVRYYAGDSIELAATLTLNGTPIRNATVTLHLSAPGRSKDNWLARNPVTDEEFAHSAKILSKEDVIALGIKSHALKFKGLTFDSFTKSSTTTMTDAADLGVYTATVRDMTTPGTYTFYLTATGQTEEGVLFRREKQLQVRVGVRPDAKFTLLDIGYVQVFEGDVPFYLAKVQVWPRDRFGNVVLIDPETNPTVQLTAKGGEFIGPLVGNLDGSYTRSLRYASEVYPAIGLQVAGEEVIPKCKIAPIAQLHYAERVIDFKLGNEAEEGANQHRDPQAALGNVTSKKADEFVSLGGLGSLTVGIAGQVKGQAEQQVILAQGDDDVTVFVQLDEDMRPYLVEALPVSGMAANWVELGTSPGTTQSFGLGQAGLKAAQAIRITDKSGRTRDSEFKPVSTPGVGIRGIGFKCLGPKPAVGVLPFRITGQVREEESGRGVSGLMIRAYDKDLIYDDLLGSTTTDENGRFKILYAEKDFRELFEKKPDIYLAIYAVPGRLILDTEEAIRWNVDAHEHFEFEIDRKTLGDAAPGRTNQS